MFLLRFQPGLTLLDQCAPDLIRTLSLGDIPRHLGETAQQARFIVNGCNDDVSPEAGSVFADTPPFLFEATLGTRNLELESWLSGTVVDIGIEDAEILPDDLVRRIALDGLRPRVPGRDVPLGVEEEDRVILHGCHQQPEDFLALPQAFFVLA